MPAGPPGKPDHSGPDRLRRAEITPEQFFAETEAAFERALAASGGAISRDFCIAGGSARLNFAGSILVEPLTRALAHLASTPLVTPGLTVGLWDVASTGIRLPPSPWSVDDYGAKGEILGYGDEAVLAAFQLDTLSLLLYHRRKRRAYYVTLDAAKLPSYETSAPLRAIWYWWTRERGLQLVHAGAVGTQAGGILLAGSGGAGKSNTALVCLQSELGYASDDYCLVQPEPAPSVYSLFSSAKTQRADLARLPFLQNALSNPAGTETDKGVYFLHEHFPERIIRSFPLRALLILRVKGQRDTSIVPATAAEALLALGPSTRSQLPYAGGEVLVRIAQIVRRVPCSHLNLGTDTSQIPRAILDFLGKYSAPALTA